MANKIKMHSIRNQILAYFVILIIPIIVVGVVAYNSALKVVSNMAIDSVENMIDRIDIETDRLMENAQQFAYMISRDSGLQIPLREPLPPTMNEVYQQRLNYNYQLYYTNQYKEEIEGFYIVGNNGTIFKSDMKTPKSIDFREQQWYRDIMESDDGVWFEPHIDSFFATTVGQELISVGVPIIDRFTGDKLGVVLVDLDVGRFQDNYKAQLIREGKMLLLNEYNQILLSPETVEAGIINDGSVKEILEQTDLTGEDSISTVQVEKDRYFVSHKASQINGWKTVGIIPFSEISKDAKSISVTVLLLTVISSVVTVFFALKASTSISEPIKKMSDTMQLVQEGDLCVRAETDREDELGHLAITFNNMIEQINILMQEQEEHQTKLRKAEQRVLQAQISPHFLYNTLGSISWMARTKDIEQIDEVIEALTIFYRITLSRGRDLITLGEEITHVHSYLRIMQVRYNKKMSYEIDIPKDITKYLMVKMTLQPLVENAIYHGVKEKREKGVVRIEGYEEEYEIVIKVIDTGKGMSQKTTDALNYMVRKDEEPKGGKVDSYGVINVNRRLQIYFGDEYGLHYKSTPLKGTTVTIRLPKRVEGDGSDA